MADEELEGYNDDPAITKVVDRRWFERNKHIFPASAWAEYAPDKDLSKVQRKDTEGNAFFFSWEESSYDISRLNVKPALSEPLCGVAVWSPRRIWDQARFPRVEGCRRGVMLERRR
jgi:hypothetical protein